MPTIHDQFDSPIDWKGTRCILKTFFFWRKELLFASYLSVLPDYLDIARVFWTWILSGLLQSAWGMSLHPSEWWSLCCKLDLIQLSYPLISPSCWSPQTEWREMIFGTTQYRCLNQWFLLLAYWIWVLLLLWGLRIACCIWKSSVRNWITLFRTYSNLFQWTGACFSWRFAHLFFGSWVEEWMVRLLGAAETQLNLCRPFSLKIRSLRFLYALSDSWHKSWEFYQTNLRFLPFVVI